MSLPNFSLENRVAIITGGKRGIGKAIALAFAEAGADVAVCTRKLKDADDDLDAVAEEIRRLGRRSLALQTDISSKADVDNMVQTVMDEFGHIDILVNNAFVNVPKQQIDLTEEDWDVTMDTDLKGYFFCCQSVSKRMVTRQTGSIINIASIMGIKAPVGRGAYPIAKAGVIQLTKVLALELAPFNIRVNTIAPGYVNTSAAADLKNNPEALHKLQTSIPMGRMAETSDITGSALFLASDTAGYITGHTLVVDGGYLLFKTS